MSKGLVIILIAAAVWVPILYVTGHPSSAAYVGSMVFLLGSVGLISWAFDRKNRKTVRKH